MTEGERSLASYRLGRPQLTLSAPGLSTGSLMPIRGVDVSQSFRLSFHQAPCRITGAHQLDGPPNLTCQDSTRQHAVDGCPLSYHPLLAARGRGSPRASPPCVTRWNIWCPVHCDGDGLSGLGRRISRLIIRLIIQTIRRDPTGSVWTDRGPNVSRPDRSGADQIDAEHQATDLAVGGSNPSWRAQRPRSAAWGCLLAC